jgi:FkbM family methyltransferase
VDQVISKIRQMKLQPLTRNSVRSWLRALSAVTPLWQTLRWIRRHGLLPRMLTRHLPVRGTFRVEVGGTRRRFLYSSIASDMVGRYLFWDGAGGDQPETVDVFLSLIDESTRFVDVGANTGLFTLIACASKKNLCVVAFEPVPRVFDRLKWNVEQNGFTARCILRQQVVADHIGKSWFHVLNVDLPTSASLNQVGFRGRAGDLMEIDTTTIDHVRKAVGAIDLVKIDVEGFEPAVLAGMRETLAKDRPIVILECHVDGPAQSVRSELDPHGYAFYHCRPGAVRRSDTLAPDPAFPYRNWLCVPENRGEEVERLLAGKRRGGAA